LILAISTQTFGKGSLDDFYGKDFSEHQGFLRCDRHNASGADDRREIGSHAMISKIVSGGQTGADRAALDFAIQHFIPYSGWVPKGRKAEDGPVPESYELQEMPTGDYSQRTEKNVLYSDGTLIVSHGMLTGGSAMTEFYAQRHCKPCLHIDLDKIPLEEAAARILAWIDDSSLQVLNVAGPRAGKDPKIYSATFKLLEALFKK